MLWMAITAVMGMATRVVSADIKVAILWKIMDGDGNSGNDAGLLQSAVTSHLLHTVHFVRVT